MHWMDGSKNSAMVWLMDGRIGVEYVSMDEDSPLVYLFHLFLYPQSY
jgi:hypothetical protein